MVYIVYNIFSLLSDPIEVESMWFKTKKIFQYTQAADRREKITGAALDDGETTSNEPLMTSIMWMKNSSKPGSKFI